MCCNSGEKKKPPFDQNAKERSTDASLSSAGCLSAEVEELLPPPGPSRLSLRVQRLRSAVLSAVEKRERLPRQLFWSLFASEVEEIRQQKNKQRMLRKILLNIEE